MRKVQYQVGSSRFLVVLLQILLDEYEATLGFEHLQQSISKTEIYHVPTGYSLYASKRSTSFALRRAQNMITEGPSVVKGDVASSTESQKPQ